MTAPSKMPSPKEALEATADLIVDCVPDDLVEKPAYLRQLQAAIPVAELYEQIVELMPRLIDTARTHAMQTHSRVSRSLADEADALLTQLEALKCTPQK